MKDLQARSLPAALLQDLDTVPGFDQEAFLTAHTRPAVTSVRKHPQKNAVIFQDAGCIPWCPYGLYLNERPVFTLDPFYHAGAYYVQEASSMFLDLIVRHLLPERDNLRVLDLCAAPGGKSTLLASLLGPDSLLISNEVIRTRASILEENVTRWGYTNNWVTSNDPKAFAKLEGYFDLVVVDAPCSGSGLFRKDQRALDEWSEANVALCHQRQQRIIADVWDALKEQGRLVYATCSYSPQEDEDVLDWLSEHFDVTSMEVNVPAEWGVVTTRSKSGLTGYRFFPDKVEGEGFFIAAVRKNEVTRTTQIPKFKSLHDRKAAAQSAFLLQNPDTFSVIPVKEGFTAIAAGQEADYHLLSQHIYLRKAGVLLGSPANKDWLPAHEMALSLDRSAAIPSVAVNTEQALKFLKKEETGLHLPEKGWLLIQYNGLGLGWVKSLGNRINNYLPKSWRIRMDLPSEWD